MEQDRINAITDEFNKYCAAAHATFDPASSQVSLCKHVQQIAMDSMVAFMSRTGADFSGFIRCADDDKSVLASLYMLHSNTHFRIVYEVGSAYRMSFDHTTQATEI